MCTVINDNTQFFHWMIVVRNGQVFKYSQNVTYLNTRVSIWAFKQNLNTDINCSIWRSTYLNTVVEVSL